MRTLIPLMIAARHESRFSCPECGYRDKSRGTRIAAQLHRDGGFNFLNYNHYYVTFDVKSGGIFYSSYLGETCVELIKEACAILERQYIQNISTIYWIILRDLTPDL